MSKIKTKKAGDEMGKAYMNMAVAIKDVISQCQSAVASAVDNIESHRAAGTHDKEGQEKG